MYLLYSVNVYIFNVVIEIKFYSILFYSNNIIYGRNGSFFNVAGYLYVIEESRDRL